MKITLRLVGTRPKDTSVLRLSMESGDGKTLADQHAVFDYVSNNATVLGLQYQFGEGGVITYTGPDRRLNTSIVAELRTVFSNALKQI